jgi:hypothetical protein
MSGLDVNDFVMYQSGGKLLSGGFNINVDGVQSGGGINNLLDSLAIPLYYFSAKGGKKNYHKYDESNEEDANNIVDPDIYEKLLKMVEVDEDKKELKKRGTRKHIDNKLLKKRGTKKNLVKK